MKKQNLKSLKLNKKSISNFQIKGGKPPRSRDCPPPVSLFCEPDEPNWISMAYWNCI